MTEIQGNATVVMDLTGVDPFVDSVEIVPLGYGGNVAVVTISTRMLGQSRDDDSVLGTPLMLKLGGHQLQQIGTALHSAALIEGRHHVCDFSGCAGNDNTKEEVDVEAYRQEGRAEVISAINSRLEELDKLNGWTK